MRSKVIKNKGHLIKAWVVRQVNKWTKFGPGQCIHVYVQQLILVPYISFKGILSTKIVICSYPKLLSFSVSTLIKWRLTPSYAAKDTIFWQKRPKTIVIRIIVLDDNIQIYSYGLLCEPVLSMHTV